MLLCLQSWTVIWKSYISRRNIGWQPHPLPHRFYDAKVPVHSRVDPLLPATVLDASIPTHVVSVCLAVRHTLGTLLLAFWGQTVLTVWTTVWEAIGANWFDKSIRWKHQFYLPVCVISSKHLNIKVPMPIYILFLDKHRTSVAHIPRGRARELVIMAVELDSISLWGNRPTAQREFFGIVWLPYLNFGNIVRGEASVRHVLRKGWPEIVRVVLAHK